MQKIKLLISCLVFFMFMTIAQNVSKPKNTYKANIIRKAEKAYQNGKPALAEVHYKQFIEQAVPKSVPVSTWLTLADCYWQMRNFDACLNTYKTLFEYNNPKLSTTDKIRLSELYARNEQYDKAYEWLKDIPAYKQKADGYTDRITQLSMKRDSAEWEVEPLKVSDGYRVFAPTLIDSLLVFSSNRPSVGKGKEAEWDGSNLDQLWQVNTSSLQTLTPVKQKAEPKRVQIIRNEIIKKRLAGVYEGSDVSVQPRDKYAYKIRQFLSFDEEFDAQAVAGLDNERSKSLTIAIDRDKDIFFSSSDEDTNASHLKQGQFNGSQVNNIHKVNLQEWLESYSLQHPAVNPDGTIIVFASDKKDGRGGYDLYISRRSDKSKPWGKPENLSVINSPGNDVYPNITSDGYLYFSSDARPGLGGLDIYRVKLEDIDGGTAHVEHLSWPINSPGDDYGWAAFNDGKTGFFTTDRRNSLDNIYRFKYTPSTELYGYVKNKLTGLPLDGVTVFALNRVTGKVEVHKSDAQGKYSIRSKPGVDFVVRAVVNPYDSVLGKSTTNETSTALRVTNQHGGAIAEDLQVHLFNMGSVLRVDTVYYGFDKWGIRRTAVPELKALIELLKTYPMLKVEISAYADRRGTVAYNQILTQRRAQKIADYIIDHGIDSVRIVAKGYGKSNYVKCPDGVPCPESLHQYNRRSEIRVNGLLNGDSPESKFFDMTRFRDGDILDSSQFPSDFFKIAE